MVIYNLFSYDTIGFCNLVTIAAACYVQYFEGDMQSVWNVFTISLMYKGNVENQQEGSLSY